MNTAQTCPRCHSPKLEARLEPPTSPHYAKLVCSECGSYIKWLPRPAPTGEGPPTDILALVRPRKNPCPLRGTEKQKLVATPLRHRAIHFLIKRNREDLAALVRCIEDSTWFFANRGKPLAEWRWPKLNQMADTRETGPCPVCGEPKYGGKACSDECLNEIATRETLGEVAAPSRSTVPAQGTAKPPWE